MTRNTRGCYTGIMLLSASLLFNGCASMGNADKTWKGAAVGTAGGAAVGAGVGATQGKPGKGALWGAVGGAVIGTTAGVLLDRQEERLRQAGIATERDQYGRLLVSLPSENLQFDTGEATIKPEGKEVLDKIASVLEEHPENRIRIAGHTDSVGSDTSNQILSQARADSVMTYLISQGVSANSIVSSVGYGEEYPVTTNDSEAGRAQNRRVELNVTVDEEAARSQSQG